jgi:hypothetical protein
VGDWWLVDWVIVTRRAFSCQVACQVMLSCALSSCQCDKSQSSPVIFCDPSVTLKQFFFFFLFLDSNFIIPLPDSVAVRVEDPDLLI